VAGAPITALVARYCSAVPRRGPPLGGLASSDLPRGFNFARRSGVGRSKPDPSLGIAARAMMDALINEPPGDSRSDIALVSGEKASSLMLVRS
jgi:hypothetical protein